MVKVPEMPIKQEKVLSSEFHMEMLKELERHHDEHSIDWSLITADSQLLMALRQIDLFTGGEPDPKRLVHAANHLTIAWAIVSSKLPDGT